MELRLAFLNNGGGSKMYHSSAQWSGNRRATRPFQSSANRGRSGLSPRERTRLTQLAACLILFLTVFLGKGIFPNQLMQVQEQLRSILMVDTNFQDAFSNLGQSLSQQGTIWEELGNFCVEVFGGTPKESQWDSEYMERELAFLNQRAAPQENAAHYLRREQVPAKWFETQPAPPPPEEPAQTEIPAVGTVLIPSNYSGIPLPEHYTMDKLSLGGLQTTTPLLGKMTSAYGYRDHPIDKEYKFHNGVDIAGSMGAAVGAFASGTVDYIGKNDIHGLYLQLDHGNGIKSFYAHCSQLCVTKGQSVAMGEKVAEVGSTGVATGPHLHFELKWNGLHLNPADYITIQTS